MITGISLSDTQDYISKYDKDEPKTVFKIGVLVTDVFTTVSKMASSKDQSIDALTEAVRFGVKGFDGFKDKQGNKINFDTANRNVNGVDYQVLTNRIINMIPVDVVIELGGEILRITKLSEAEVKNL